MTFRHRHFRRSSLIETAQSEERKAEVYEKGEEANREKSGPERQLLQVILRLDLAEKQENARTCPKVRQVCEKVCGRKEESGSLSPQRWLPDFSGSPNRRTTRSRQRLLSDVL